MKNREKIKQIERAVLAAESEPAAAVPTDEWQRQVMAEVKRAARPEPQIIEFPIMRFAWATAAAATVVLCFGVWFYQTTWMLDSMTIDIAGGLNQVVSSL